jgi:hypothetical protein
MRARGPRTELGSGAQQMLISVRRELQSWLDHNLDHVLGTTIGRMEKDFARVEEVVDLVEREDYDARARLVDRICRVEEALQRMESSSVETSRHELRTVLYDFVGELQEDLRERDERLKDLADTFGSFTRRALDRLRTS